MLVTIIIPAYRQQNTIQKDVRRIHRAMSKTRWLFEIIVVDDGSPDRTFMRAKKVVLPNYRVIGYKTNRGKGYAVKYGMARARGDIVAFIDSGLEIDPNNISLILEHLEWYKADIMVGSKRHPASKVNYSRMRRIYSWGYYLIVRILFGFKVTDTQAGLKVFRRNVLEKVLPRLLVKAFAFDIELLAVAYRLGFRKIYDAPVRMSLRFSKNSKIKRWPPLFLEPNVRKMLQDTLAVFYRLKILKYYDDNNRRRWRYDKELDMKINTGL